MARRYRIILDVEAGFDASRVTADWVHRVIQPTLDQYGVELLSTQVVPLAEPGR